MDNTETFGSKDEILHSLQEIESKIHEEEEKEDINQKKINELRYAQLMKGLYLQLFK